MIPLSVEGNYDKAERVLDRFESSLVVDANLQARCALRGEEKGSIPKHTQVTSMMVTFPWFHTCKPRAPPTGLGDVLKGRP